MSDKTRSLKQPGVADVVANASSGSSGRCTYQKENGNFFRLQTANGGKPNSFLPNFLTLCPTVGTSPAMYRRPRSPTLDWPQCPPPPPPQRRSSTSPEQVSLTAFKIEFVASVPRLRWVSRENLYTKPNSISASDV